VAVALVKGSMLASGPLQLRIALAHVDRGIERVQKLIVARDAALTLDDMLLRAVAFCLFFEEGLRIVDGPSRRGVPDLAVTRLDGKIAVWISCGAADAEEIRRVIAHNQGVAVHVLFDAPAARSAFLRQLASVRKRPPGFEDISIWNIDQDVVARLASRAELRQRWAVTVIADHLYVDSDGLKVDGEVTRLPPPPFIG
jgi:uncharacterized protein YaeQ